MGRIDTGDAESAGTDFLCIIVVKLSKPFDYMRLQTLTAEKQKNTAEQEKKREEEHIQSLARGRRACEGK
jgi:hypothetical protein